MGGGRYPKGGGRVCWVSWGIGIPKGVGYAGGWAVGIPGPMSVSRHTPVQTLTPAGGKNINRRDSPYLSTSSATQRVLTPLVAENNDVRVFSRYGSRVLMSA